MIESLQHFDVDLFLMIHRGLSNPFFDWLLPLMRNKYFWAPLYLFIIIFCVKEYKRKGWLMIGMLFLTFAIGDLMASRLIKYSVGRIRPCNESTLTNEIIHRVPCGSGYSFPSAHATNHFAIAVFLIFLFFDRWKPILPLALSWAFIISFSQIYVGVHYPIDVFGGAILGILIGLFTSKLYQKLQNKI
ncbi:phosphatase PAP2 family protein [Pedobacter sp. JCM 36344]|uniref:phosphatase PAP2 family protein n=1 Tax=Pedobacter sp. JCM 36344 TaxID=3374280 RepID=UPI0039780B4B